MISYQGCSISHNLSLLIVNNLMYSHFDCPSPSRCHPQKVIFHFWYEIYWWEVNYQWAYSALFFFSKGKVWFNTDHERMNYNGKWKCYWKLWRDQLNAKDPDTCMPFQKTTRCFIIIKKRPLAMNVNQELIASLQLKLTYQSILIPICINWIQSRKDELNPLYFRRFQSYQYLDDEQRGTVVIQKLSFYFLHCLM